MTTSPWPPVTRPRGMGTLLTSPVSAPRPTAAAALSQRFAATAAGQARRSAGEVCGHAGARPRESRRSRSTLSGHPDEGRPTFESCASSLTAQTVRPRQGDAARSREPSGPRSWATGMAALSRDRRIVTCGPRAEGPPALISTCAYMDSQGMDEITILQAEVLKTLANPRRLEILHVLVRGPIEVGRLAEAIGRPSRTSHSTWRCFAPPGSSRRSGMGVTSAIGLPIRTSWSPAGSCAASSNAGCVA